MQHNSLVITNEQVKAHMTLARAVARVEETWRWHGEGKIIMPPKITTDMSPAGIAGWFNAMPSYIGPAGIAGIKLVGGYQNNPKLGLPYIKANLLLTDPHTGNLLALLCGDWISDVRTGAQPAVAMKYLAASSDVVTIIGAGLQAYYSALCISLLHPIQELRVCDIREEARLQFVKRFPDAPFAITPYKSNEEACKDADVIITVTTADAPLVLAAWCKPGCLVMTMGSYTEIAQDVITQFDAIMLDHTEQALHRGSYKTFAERGIIDKTSIRAELPCIVAGKKPGRTSATERIVCELVGMGSLDVSIAAQVYKTIVETGADVLQVNMLQ